MKRLLVMVLVLAGCGSQVMRSLPLDREPVKLVPQKNAATGSCGRELWSIKTLTDISASKVNLTPMRSNIRTLRALLAPSFDYNRARSYNELQVWKLAGTRLIGWRLENDSDYHLVLKAPATGETMIAEIPDPSCATKSRVFSQIISARHSFEDAGYTGANSCFNCVNVPVTITGVSFFDALHGQTGVAPNGVELHPVLSFRRW